MVSGVRMKLGVLSTLTSRVDGTLDASNCTNQPGAMSLFVSSVTLTVGPDCRCSVRRHIGYI